MRIPAVLQIASDIVEIATAHTTATAKANHEYSLLRRQLKKMPMAKVTEPKIVNHAGFGNVTLSTRNGI